MKLIRRQKIWLAIVIVANATLWVFPSDVVEQIARDRQTMLGRYSRTQFSWMLGVFIISLISFYIDWSTGKTYKRRWFQVIATMIFLTPLLVVVDFVLPSTNRVHYVHDGLVYHRPPGFSLETTIEDKPEAYRSYPNAPPGYGEVTCKISIDAMGFRNTAQRKHYDVVALGDSFTEGSRVSDDQPWPVRLASEIELSVYNLGMSGYNPIHYAGSLERYGLAFAPTYVVCMLYEGNDFRLGSGEEGAQAPSLADRISKRFKQSPIIHAVDGWMVETFAPLRADAPIANADAISWLPLAIPQGPFARYYVFAPKQLRDMYDVGDGFYTRWLATRQYISQMRDRCREVGCKLILAYAPTKAHVVLPIVGLALPAEQVKAFLALRYKDELPDPDLFLETLLTNVEHREKTVREWCESEGIVFMSTTNALRAATAAGLQTYYTYDQHWTPAGHEIVASAIRRFMQTELAGD